MRRVRYLLSALPLRETMGRAWEIFESKDDAMVCLQAGHDDGGGGGVFAGISTGCGGCLC